MSQSVKENGKARKKVVAGYKKVEQGVVGGYKKIEKGAVGGYKKIEKGAVEGFQKVSDRVVEGVFSREGETVEQTKKRLSGASFEKENEQGASTDSLDPENESFEKKEEA